MCERAQREGIAHHVAFLGEGAARTVAPEGAKALLRVAQGALANIREHAEARNVLLSLSAQPNRTVLLVHDDEIGFNPTRIRPEHGRGFGLPALRERMRSCGGTLILESSPGHGTSVTATLPSAPIPARRATPEAHRRGLIELA